MFQCAGCGYRILDLDCRLNASARDAVMAGYQDAIAIDVTDSIQIQTRYSAIVVPIQVIV
jgi:hypothetical protein